MPRRKVIARTITARDALWRPHFNRAVPLVLIAIATTAPSLSNPDPASATAATTPNCLRGMPSPSYQMPDMCNRLLPLVSTTKRRFGGTAYNYQGPEGQIVSLTVPSPTFNSATASPEELREAGVPPEPPSSSPEYPKWEAMIKAGIQFARPEATLEQRVEQIPAPSPGVPDPVAAGPGTLPAQAGSLVSEESSRNWSGYFEWGGEGHFTKADLYYKDPANKHDSCESGGAETETSIWSGLGGNYGTAPLAQTGTLMGNHTAKGLVHEQEAWFEVPNGEPKYTEPYKTPLKVIPGDWVQADVQYDGHEEFSFFVEDLGRHEATHAIGHGKVDANVADFIIERTAPENLVNFGDVQMQGFTNNKAYAANRQKIQRETLLNANGETMAKPGQVLSNGYEFFDKYENRCSDEGFGTGLNGNAESAPPTATTETAESVGSSTATLKGVVNPEGQEARYDFEYGTEEYNYSESTPELSAGSGSSPVKVSSAITGLSPGTTYHYRVIADGAGGIVAGTDHTFKTTGTPPPPPPTVTTEGADAIGTQTATVEATVNPNGGDTHYYIEYGRHSGRYEASTPSPPGNDAGAGSAPVKVSVGLTSLAPYSTYYYRVVASNSTGTSYGTQKEFTTQFAEPVYSTHFGEFKNPQFAAIDGSGDVWVTELHNYCVQEFSESGTLIRAVGSTGTGNGECSYPEGVAINQATGDVYVVDTDNDRVEEFSTANGEFIRAFGSKGSGPGQFENPIGIAVEPGAGGDVWVTDDVTSRIEKFSPTGTFIAAYGKEGKGDGEFRVPWGITVDESDDVYVTDLDNQRVEEFSPEGEYLNQFDFKGGVQELRSIAWDPTSGSLFLDDWGSAESHIKVLTSSGTLLGEFETRGAGPDGIAINSSGDIYGATSSGFVEKWLPPAA
jgi:DNA-binding beta-propeller fold protein YncE